MVRRACILQCELLQTRQVDYHDNRDKSPIKLSQQLCFLGRIYVVAHIYVDATGQLLIRLHGLGLVVKRLCGHGWYEGNQSKEWSKTLLDMVHIYQRTRHSYLHLTNGVLDVARSAYLYSDVWGGPLKAGRSLYCSLEDTVHRYTEQRLLVRKYFYKHVNSAPRRKIALQFRWG